MIFECIAAEYGLPVKGGFKGTQLVHYHRLTELRSILFEVLKREDFAKGLYDFYSPGEKGINLIKLHGSLDLFGKDDELNCLKLVPNPNSIEGITQGLRILNTEMQYRIGGVGLTNAITYLDQNNTLQFLQRSLLTGVHKFQPKRIRQVAPPEFLSLFEANLNYADQLLALGYSFGDNHVNQVVRNWLSFAGSRTLIVVDPVPKVPVDFGHLSRQIRSEKMLVTDYLIDALEKKARGKLPRLNQKYKFYGRIAKNRMIKKALNTLFRGAESAPSAKAP